MIVDTQNYNPYIGWCITGWEVRNDSLFNDFKQLVENYGNNLR